MISKISMNNIISEFFSMMKTREKLGFILIPFIISAAVASIRFNVNTVETFILVLTIFVALLLNLLVIAITLKDDKKKIEVGGDTYTIKYFLKRFNHTVCFGIFIAIVNILEIFLFSFNLSNNVYYVYFLNLLIIWGFLSFIITLFVILKRTHILVGFYLED